MSTETADSPTLTTGVCVRCMHDADFEIAGVWLCMDCYHVAGSTCAGVATPSTPTDQVC